MQATAVVPKDMLGNKVVLYNPVSAMQLITPSY